MIGRALDIVGDALYDRGPRLSWGHLMALSVLVIGLSISLGAWLSTRRLPPECLSTGANP